jgi:hypothetical protein
MVLTCPHSTNISAFEDWYEHKLIYEVNFIFYAEIQSAEFIIA